MLSAEMNINNRNSYGDMEPACSLGWGHIPTNNIATRSCSARGIFVFRSYYLNLLHLHDLRVRYHFMKDLFPEQLYALPAQPAGETLRTFSGRQLGSAEHTQFLNGYKFDVVFHKFIDTNNKLQSPLFLD
jgi:hypothetical protein